MIKTMQVGLDGTSARLEELNHISTQQERVHIGRMCGMYNSNASSTSVLIGYEAGKYARNTQNNVFVGFQSGMHSEDDSNNVYIGYQCGYSTNQGSSNVFIGNLVGFGNKTGFNNTFIGDQC